MRKQDKNIVNLRSRSNWENLIQEWVHDERDRKMLERLLLDGKTISEIACEFGLSDVQTQSRLSKSKKQLFNHV